MSINSLFRLEGSNYNIYCNEMHCKNMVPPSGTGTQGDIYNVDALGIPRFGKIIDGVGPTQPLQIKNMPLEILSDNGLAPAILGVGSDAAHGMPAIIGMGNLATQDSFFFAYDDTVKNLSLGQNNACVNHNFSIGLGTGNFGLTAQNANFSTDDISFGKVGDHLDSLITYADLNQTNGSNLVHNDSNITIGGNNCVITAPIKFEGQVKDSSNSAGSANQYLASNGTNVTWTNIPSSNLISTVTHTTPGAYNIVVPASATLAKLTGVGGGGGSCLHIGFASPGGGAAGSIFDYPVSVLAGQTIAVTVGSGGAVNADGTDTVFSIGSQTITCGKGLTSTDQLHGGNGGSVNLSFTTIAGGAGGAFQAQGANGNSSYFVCSGAGAGGTRANGGNVILFTGGIADANYGGGGASAFANGANNHTSGTKGSGGGADNGTGGDGFITISFYS